MVMIETRHERYQLEAEIPIGLAEQLFGMCELTGTNLDQFVTDALWQKLKGGAQ